MGAKATRKTRTATGPLFLSSCPRTSTSRSTGAHHRPLPRRLQTCSAQGVGRRGSGPSAGAVHEVPTEADANAEEQRGASYNTGTRSSRGRGYKKTKDQPHALAQVRQIGRFRVERPDVNLEGSMFRRKKDSNPRFRVRGVGTDTARSKNLWLDRLGAK